MTSKEEVARAHSDMPPKGSQCFVSAGVRLWRATKVPKSNAVDVAVAAAAADDDDDDVVVGDR